MVLHCGIGRIGAFIKQFVPVQGLVGPVQQMEIDTGMWIVEIEGRRVEHMRFVEIMGLIRSTVNKQRRSFMFSSHISDSAKKKQITSALETDEQKLIRYALQLQKRKIAARPFIQKFRRLAQAADSWKQRALAAEKDQKASTKELERMDQPATG